MSWNAACTVIETGLTNVLLAVFIVLPINPIPPAHCVFVILCCVGRNPIPESSPFPKCNIVFVELEVTVRLTGSPPEAFGGLLLGNHQRLVDRPAR